MAKLQKTNAMRFLETKKIKYTVNSYECDEFIDGVTMARELGQPIEQTYKTLVAQGKSKNYYCFVIPCAAELDLKAAARAVSEKSVELIHVKDINAVTGYIRGGCTPIGMKKQFVTVFDASAKDLESFYISGGRVGVQICLSPTELASSIRGEFVDICVNNNEAVEA